MEISKEYLENKIKLMILRRVKMDLSIPKIEETEIELSYLQKCGNCNLGFDEYGLRIGNLLPDPEKKDYTCTRCSFNK